jgi:serine/threonine protein kinase
MALPPGTRLGAYEIGAALGAGGMGEVYRAVDLALCRQVAVKVSRAARNFQDETRLVSRTRVELLAGVVTGSRAPSQAFASRALRLMKLRRPNIAGPGPSGHRLGLYQH